MINLGSLAFCKAPLSVRHTSPDRAFRSSLELLIESGKFRPNRTIILSFGIDEETGGRMVRVNITGTFEADDQLCSLGGIRSRAMGGAEVWTGFYCDDS